MTDTSQTTPIPGPPGYPLVGNALEVDLETPLLTWQGWAEEYGEIFRVNLPAGEFVVVSSQRLVHEVCDEKRFRKPVKGALNQVRNGVHDGLFTAREDEPNWGIAHRILMPAFGPASIQGMFDEMHEIASQLALKWARHGPDAAIMVTDDFTRLTLDTLALCTMDFRFNSYYHDELHPFISAMGSFLTESGSRSLRPSLAALFYGQADRKYWEDIELMRQTAQGVLDSRRKHPSGRKDLLSAMLDGVDPKTGQKLSDASIIDNLITFLIAGHETTSGLLSFAFYQLLKHPDAYRKAQDEVDGVVGKGPIQPQHIKKLPYIEAILRETLRLCPTIPLIGKQAREDEIIGGQYFIPKDQTCLLLFAQSHLDPVVYGETARAFMPERMLDENFERLMREYPDCWKPFGSGMRACIGRPFAWQEAVLVMAMLLQNFDFAMHDPGYELHIKQTLTTKPKDFYMRATLRHGQTATELEHRLNGALASTLQPLSLNSKPASSRQPSPAAAKSRARADLKPMSIFYGSNTGTCESLAHRLATDAASHGFAATVIEPLDAATEKLPTDRPVAVITASYEGQPPDNAVSFWDWLQRCKARDELKGVSFAVFGCGHHDWGQTFHRIPKLVDQAMEARGGTRLCETGLTDVAEGDMFTDLEQWEDDVFWPAIEAKYGSAGAAVNGDDQGDASSSLEVRFSTPRSSTLRQDVREATVIAERTLTSPGVPPKKHLEVQLPEGMTYKVGDYIAVLPINPKESVNRVMRRFHLSWDSHVTIGSDRWTALPTGTPVPVYDVLGCYVELSQPATKRGILRLAEAAKDDATKQQLHALAGDAYAAEISLKRTPILDLLERFPAVSLSFGTFLSLLPSMRPRQYSISSSPVFPPHGPGRATLTYSLLDSPALANPSVKHVGVATSYLASLQPGDKLHLSVRATHTGFRLPDNKPDGTPSSVPIIMIAAGAGLAPFRGFVQERAAAIAQMNHSTTKKGDDDGERQKNNINLAPALLFFGCRGPHLDDLYREEFDAWQRDGVVDVRRAYSRPAERDNENKEEEGESKGCRHVQDRLWLDRDEVKRLWDAGARVYVCGSRAVGDAVKKVVGRILLGDDATEAEVAQWFDDVRNDRYASDVFD